MLAFALELAMGLPLALPHRPALPPALAIPHAHALAPALPPARPRVLAFALELAMGLPLALPHAPALVLALAGWRYMACSIEPVTRNVIPEVAKDSGHNYFADKRANSVGWHLATNFFH